MLCTVTRFIFLNSSSPTLTCIRITWGCWLNLESHTQAFFNLMGFKWGLIICISTSSQMRLMMVFQGPHLEKQYSQISPSIQWFPISFTLHLKTPPQPRYLGSYNLVSSSHPTIIFLWSPMKPSGFSQTGLLVYYPSALYTPTFLPWSGEECLSTFSYSSNFFMEYTQNPYLSEACPNQTISSRFL